MGETSEGVLIRDFRKSDLEDFLEVAKKSFAEEFEISGFDPDSVRKMANQMFSILGKIFLGFLKLMGKEPLKLFAAEVDGRLVGTTLVNLRGKVGYIAMVMVHPAYRRRGIATKLMKSALDHVLKRKLKRAILHVASTDTPAKNLYRKLGFRKFEKNVHLIGEIDFLRMPEKVERVLVRSFDKKDMDAVYELIRCSEYPTHLEMFGFKKKDLKTSLVKRLFHFSREKKIVAVKDEKIVGYAEASYTTAKEAGHIRNIQIYPKMRAKGIEEMLIEAGVNYIKKVGTNRVEAVTLSTRKELIEKIQQLGFKKRLEMEAMVLEF